MPEVLIPGYECTRCRHQWIGRRHKPRPVVCPKCKSPYWDREKRIKRIAASKEEVK